MAKNQNVLEDWLTNLIAGVIVVVVVVVLLFFLAIKIAALLLPYACIIWLLVLVIQYFRHDRRHIMNRFKLSNIEQKEYRDAIDNFNWAINKLERCEQEIINKGLRRNADGRLSQRSYAGQDIQSAIDNANEVKRDSISVYSYYKELPIKRYKKARKRCARIGGLVLALVIGFSLMSISSNTSNNKDKTNTEIIVKNQKKVNNQQKTKSYNKTKEVKNADKTEESWLGETDSIVVATYMCGAYGIGFLTYLIFFSIAYRKPKG